jgi:hypothetical protein
MLSLSEGNHQCLHGGIKGNANEKPNIPMMGCNSPLEAASIRYLPII